LSLNQLLLGRLLLALCVSQPERAGEKKSPAARADDHAFRHGGKVYQVSGPLRQQLQQNSAVFRPDRRLQRGHELREPTQANAEPEPGPLSLRFRPGPARARTRSNVQQRRRHSRKPRTRRNLSEVIFGGISVDVLGSQSFTQGRCQSQRQTSDRYRDGMRGGSLVFDSGGGCVAPAALSLRLWRSVRSKLVPAGELRAVYVRTESCNLTSSGIILPCVPP